MVSATEGTLVAVHIIFRFDGIAGNFYCESLVQTERRRFLVIRNSYFDLRSFSLVVIWLVNCILSFTDGGCCQ